MFSDTKKQKMSIIKSIITHSGSFHADESLAIFMLKTLPKYKDHSIIRTRNPAVIVEGDIVVDVGGEYNPATNRYDHHQRGFVETYSPAYDVKLSSAGLIYKHFGTKVVQAIVGAHPQTDEIVSRVYKKLSTATITGYRPTPPTLPPNTSRQPQSLIVYRDSTRTGTRHQQTRILTGSSSRLWRLQARSWCTG
jgi:Uncharacterised protein family (UPF0160)